LSSKLSLSFRSVSLHRAIDTERRATEAIQSPIDLPAAWAKAGLSERRDLRSMLFPDGLVWSHSMAF